MHFLFGCTIGILGEICYLLNSKVLKAFYFCSNPRHAVDIVGGENLWCQTVRFLQMEKKTKQKMRRN